ncbi:MAG: aldehyde dehydrogenase family protein [Hyphomicrobiaceae bacterium]
MSRMLRCVSPIDGSIYAEREVASLEAVKEAADSARRAQAEWADQPIAERIRLVLAGVARVGEMNEDVITELAWQMGRPICYGGEFSGFKERATHMAQIAIEALRPLEIENTSEFQRFIAREPLGIGLVIAPWNYPWMTAINSVAPALIAGNGILLKHSTQTMLVGERMTRAFHEAGVPSALFQNVFLDHETTASLIGDKAFAFVNFTGSVAAGRTIERAAAGTFINVGLELGGKDPGYVLEDADIDAAANTLIDGAMFNSGQSCCGIERIYVVAPLYDAFVEKAVSLAESYILGNPLEPATTLGPMANKRFADEVRGQMSEALANGAKGLVDAKQFPADEGTYLAPQILVDVDHTMRVMRDETFGPIVGVMKVSSDDEAIALMNDSDFGLTASLWTRDRDRAISIGRRIETGTVFMNRADYLDPALCWTGCKDTGRGASLSVLGYQAVSRPKSYHLK